LASPAKTTTYTTSIAKKIRSGEKKPYLDGLVVQEGVDGQGASLVVVLVHFLAKLGSAAMRGAR
jgi:hypothetical protein